MRQLILVYLLLTGCGQPSEDAVATNHNFGWHYDVSSQNLMVRYAPNQNRVGQDGIDHLTIDELDSYYRDVAASVGLSLPEKTLLIFTYNPDDTNGESGGITFSDTGTIILRANLDFSLDLFGHYALCHEYMHAILFANNLMNESFGHDPAYFSKCPNYAKYTPH